MQYTIGHNCYYVRNKEQALEFYRDKLGLKFMFEQTFPERNMYIIYMRVCKGQFIELIGDLPHEDKPKSSFAHLCLHVEDIHAVHTELSAKGLNPTPVEMGMAKCLKFYLDDPDGNTIEMMQLLPESMQTIHDHD